MTTEKLSIIENINLQIAEYNGRCPSCAMVRVNGVVIHEENCPDGHLFLVRGCLWCGSDFCPDTPRQKFCSEECRHDYHS